MRRTLVVLALTASLGTLALRPWAAAADVSHTALCTLTSYTVSGSFTLVGGAASFTVDATGSCVGTPGTTGVIVSINYNSVGPWSCIAGAGQGSGRITASNGFTQDVQSSLVNVGGEYVIEVAGVGTVAAAGQFTTLPIPCDLGQTQTTVAGTGTLTFTA